MPPAIERLGDFAAAASQGLNWLVERLCALLALVLVLDVWLGVFVRYVWPLPLTFTEEAARYLMIWMALLAVSCGIARREHIGVQLLFDALPQGMQRALLFAFDALALAFFGFLLVYGLDMVDRGSRSYTMIFGLTKSLPFAAVPAAAALACVQLVLVAIRDQVRFGTDPSRGIVT
ncbi:MAG: TRAP transporter small permease subunit [Candidatus Competibacterales bacterium]|nr:TRAP transporter small permease subunit [Candidatus Competibacterales bacterium]